MIPILELLLPGTMALVLRPTDFDTDHRPLYPLYHGAFPHFAQLLVYLSMDPAQISTLPCCPEGKPCPAAILPLKKQPCANYSACKDHPQVFVGNFSFKEFKRQKEVVFICQAQNAKPVFNLNELRPAQYSLCVDQNKEATILEVQTTKGTDFLPDYDNVPAFREVFRANDHFYLGDSCAPEQINYVGDAMISLALLGVGWLLKSILCSQNRGQYQQQGISESQVRAGPGGSTQLMADEEEYEGKLYLPRHHLIQEDMELIRREVLQ